MSSEPAIVHRATSVAGSLLFFLAVSLSAQDSTFVLATSDPTYRTPTFIGNGAFSLVSSPFGTAPSLSFAAGVYDHAAEDVPRIAALPAWNGFDVSDGDGWLNAAAGDTTVLRAYRQTLDMHDGTLRTSYEWVHGAKRTAVEVTTFVSRADPQLAEHTAAWHRLWETDVVVEGDLELQRLVHAMLFYLLASVRDGTEHSIPPMGLSSAGYYGHVFWDADTWMFPALVALHPQIARSMVDFRFHALPAARRNARHNGYRGAMYPWESDERGEETTPRFAWQNALHEIHVTGDVALAQWQYFLATGDSAWLARRGYPVIKETADFWVSRVTRDSTTGGYAIRDVVSVDEGLIGIGNDAYTNAVARRNLEIAVAASRRLGRSLDPRWSRVAAGLYIPYDSAGAYHPTYEGARPEKRGSVVPLLTFPLALPMPEQARRNDLTAAVGLLLKEGSGAMMTTALYPVIAAQLGK